MKRALKAPDLKLRDLDSKLLGRFNMVEIPTQFSISMRALFNSMPILGEVAIPSGIPVSWITELPLRGHLRNALGRYFWPHKVIVKEPIKCAELMAIPDVGKYSMHELLCVLESAELGKEHSENRIAPTVQEKTARTRGGEKRGPKGDSLFTEKRAQDKDETEHGEIKPERIGSPTVPEVTSRLPGQEERRQAGKRSIPERRSQDEDETEHGEIQPESIDSPTIPEMTARILGRENRRQTGKRATPERRSKDKGETEHSDVQPERLESPTVSENNARIPRQEKRRQTRERATEHKRLQEKNNTEQSRPEAVDRGLPKEREIDSGTSDSAFQKAVNEAACQAIRVGLLQFDLHEDISTDTQRKNEVVCSVSALGDLLREFASWARAETDAQTIGDAISLVISGAGPVEAWHAIAEFSLSQAGYRSNHPYTILESWVNHLPERERHIFYTRIACLGATPTLQDIGDFFGVSRERVRQLERKLKTKLAKFVGGIEGKPIRWRAKTVRQMIGVASPPVDQLDSATGEIHQAFSAQIENLLSPLPGQSDFREVVLGLAGPYELVDGWLVLKSAIASDPTREIRETADKIGYINQEQATRELNKWGLNLSLHERWLVRDGRIRSLNGRLVRWDGSIGDKLVVALAEIGRPATIDELLEYTKEKRAKSSAANALSNDTRAIRVSRKEWALESWGLSEYSSIAISIRKVLNRQKQPVLVEEIVGLLSKDMGLKESSIRAYCQAPMFIIENGAVRLRRGDERYEYDNVSLRKAKGVFALGPLRASLLIEVDSELLRGSGRLLTFAAGSVLEIAPNQSLTFTSRDGDVVTVTFPETSIMGPLIGSLRSLAISSNAKIGDQLTVTLDRADMSVSAVATDLTQHEPGWPLVLRLIGLCNGEGLEELAAALQTEKGQVRALLRKRGDHIVADALPERKDSSELDRALASLEAQLQQTEGSLR